MPYKEVEQEKRKNNKTNETDPAPSDIIPEKITDQHKIRSHVKQKEEGPKQELVHQLGLLAEDNKEKDQGTRDKAQEKTQGTRHKERAFR